MTHNLCVVCGKAFEGHGNSKFCRDSCRTKCRTKRRKERLAAAPTTPKPPSKTPLISSDVQILLDVCGKYAYLSPPEAVRRVAEERGFTRSGVSGMRSRAAATIAGRVALMRYLSASAGMSASKVAIDATVTDARVKLAQHRALLATTVPYYAVYLPDMHIPLQHNTALELVYNLIADIQNIAYVTTLNDGFDFSRLSRWTDRREVTDIEADIANSIAIYRQHVETLRMIAPLAVFPAIIGNHDVRMFVSETGTGDYIASNLMRDLTDVGVLFVDKPDRENVFFVNDGLAWAHGFTARKNRVGSAKANYEEMRRHVPETMQKRLYDLVVGHTHAAMGTTSPGGATITNAGCLCNLEPTYTRKRPDWQLAFAISKFLPSTDWNDTRLIHIEQRAGNLTALNPFNGNEYEVTGTFY